MQRRIERQNKMEKIVSTLLRRLEKLEMPRPTNIFEGLHPLLDLRVLMYF